MKQLLQDLSTGQLAVADVPAPTRSRNAMLVRTSCSVISAGTERAALQMGRSSLLGKARARPDVVAKVVESARTEGITATYSKVRGRLGEPNTLGYSSSGVVLEASNDAPASPGELVACAGAGHACHAEIVSVPRNLCARVPDGVTAEDAAYATVASIALHGVRLTGARLGDVVTVVGLGLVGQLTLELLAAAGCNALGIDPADDRVAIARAAGFWSTVDPAELDAEVARRTARRGADAVLVTAASRSAAPLATATAVARERATVCVVGDVPIESPRAPLFAKELRLVVSRSYGPGRYDRTYEEGGIDYPAGYVRWTEGRNLEEVLRLMATDALRPSRLTTHTFDLEEGAAAYAALGGDAPSLGILLRYDSAPEATTRSVSIKAPARARRRVSDLRFGVVGAGAFATSVLLPELAKLGDIIAVATGRGAAAHASANRFGAELATTDGTAVIADTRVNAVVIATRHDSHAAYAAAALRAGKHVFVEKPLAITAEGLADVESAVAESDGVLMVGFNRRFAPLAIKLRDALSDRGPMAVHYRVNAGRLPRDHWTHDPTVGGGRIVGEACHFVDFATFLCGGPPVETHVHAVAGGSEPREDNAVATMTFADGSLATVTYAAFGDPSLPKERIEVLGEAGAAVLDDFRELTLHVGGRKRKTSGRRDKGHAAEVTVFAEACRTGVQPWPFEDMVAVTRTTFAIRSALVGAEAHSASAGPAR